MYRSGLMADSAGQEYGVCHALTACVAHSQLDTRGLAKLTRLELALLHLKFTLPLPLHLDTRQSLPSSSAARRYAQALGSRYALSMDIQVALTCLPDEWWQEWHAQSSSVHHWLAFWRSSYPVQSLLGRCAGRLTDTRVGVDWHQIHPGVT
jgi:hypothetical protein